MSSRALTTIRPSAMIKGLKTARSAVTSIELCNCGWDYATSKAEAKSMRALIRACSASLANFEMIPHPFAHSYAIQDTTLIAILEEATNLKSLMLFEGLPLAVAEDLARSTPPCPSVTKLHTCETTTPRALELLPRIFPRLSALQIPDASGGDNEAHIEALLSCVTNLGVRWSSGCSPRELDAGATAWHDTQATFPRPGLS